MKLAFLLIPLAFFISSCAAPIENLTKTQYYNANFTKANLRDGGLALLPVTSGQSLKSYCRPLGEYLNIGLQAAVPYGKVLKWQETMKLLNKNSKINVYEELIKDYYQTSVLDKDKVKEVYSAIGTRFVLLCSLTEYSESKEMKFKLMPGWGVTKTSNVVADCLVFDLETAEVMQEIIGVAQSETGGYNEDEKFEKYAALLAKGVLTELPGSFIHELKKGE